MASIATAFQKAVNGNEVSTSTASSSKKSVTISMDDAPPKYSNPSSSSSSATLPLHVAFSPSTPAPIAAEASRLLRMAFIQKVYGILALQLFFTVIFAGWFMTNSSAKAYVNSSEGGWMVPVGVVGSFATLFALIANRKIYPKNMVLLASFTLIEAFLVGVICSRHSQLVVVQALCLTATIATGLTVYAFTTKKDFSNLGAGLTSALFAFIGILLVGIFFPFSSQMHLMIGFIGALLFSAFIIYDTQIIMKKLSIDEYILGTLNLYLDIVNLFLELLRILSNKD